MDSFEEALCRLDKHIWFIAHRFSETVKGQEVADLHQEGVILLYEIYSSARYSDKSPEELDAIFRSALKNLMKDIYFKSKRANKLIDPVPIDDVLDDYGYEPFLDVYVAHYKKALTRKLSNDAVRLLDLLLEPTPAVYHMFNIMVMRRKTIRAQGRTVRIPTKITHEIVGSVLGFSLPKTKNLIRELKEAWNRECQPSTSKFKPNAAKS